MLNRVVATLQNHNELVLEAPPGAGKTTIIPLALLDQSWLGNQKIIMLQPRRMAARAAAQRMSELINEEPGMRVGYQIRQESRVSKNTRIIVMTEGVLLRHIQQDPSLDGVGLVIFDEFHERSVDSDLSLTLCLHGRDILRESPLKLLVMSATLQGLNIKSYLQDAPLVICKGHTFPVDIRYRARQNKSGDITHDAASVITEALHNSPTSALVFLPGRAEIMRLLSLLTNNLSSRFIVLPLHGGLSKAEQNRAITPLDKSGEHEFKVILATDIAETSLTIEGIDLVVDLGLARVPQYDPNTGLTRLKTQKISKASSIQRSGRAGRLRAGTCYRLWGQSEQATLRENYAAQILQSDLAPTLLQIYAWGVDDPHNLSWIDPPPEGNLNQAQTLLLSLGAIEKKHSDQYHITDHGLAMAALPTHPRLSHMIITASSIGLKNYASIVAALLSERDTLDIGSADFSLRIDIVLGDCPCPPSQKYWLKRVKQQAEKFISACSHQPTPEHRRRTRDDGLLLSFAYPDRIAKHIGDAQRYKLSNGRIARLNPEDPLCNSKWLVVADAGGDTSQQVDKIYSAVTFNPSLFESELNHLITIQDKAFWDEKVGRFVGERLFKIGAVTQKKQALTNLNPEQIKEAVLHYLENEGFEQLPWTETIKQWQARVLLLRKHDQNHAWPDVSPENLRCTVHDWLAPYLIGIKTNADIKNLSLQEILNDLVSWSLSEELQKLAPPKIRVPSGTEATIDYLQSPPVLAIKLQEMFGCTETPTIAGGKIALMIHLLSPARRPLQITQDLAGFWERSYQDVKKEMKGRYPKHPWPDDPLAATATRFTKTRK